MLDTSLLLLKESQCSAQSAVFPSCVSPPPEKHNKSNQKPAEAELKIAQCINRENEHKCFREVHPGVGQLAGGGHRAVIRSVPRGRIGEVGAGLSGDRRGVSVLLGRRGSRIV